MPEDPLTEMHNRHVFERLRRAFVRRVTGEMRPYITGSVVTTLQNLRAVERGHGKKACVSVEDVMHLLPGPNDPYEYSGLYSALNPLDQLIEHYVFDNWNLSDWQTINSSVACYTADLSFYADRDEYATRHEFADVHKFARNEGQWPHVDVQWIFDRWDTMVLRKLRN
jgi:hypothetical protein